MNKKKLIKKLFKNIKEHSLNDLQRSVLYDTVADLLMKNYLTKEKTIIQETLFCTLDNVSDFNHYTDFIVFISEIISHNLEFDVYQYPKAGSTKIGRSKNLLALWATRVKKEFLLNSFKDRLNERLEFTLMVNLDGSRPSRMTYTI